MDQPLGPWVYFAFGVNVSAGYDDLANGYYAYKYQIEDPILRSDIQQVENSGCEDRFKETLIECEIKIFPIGNSSTECVLAQCLHTRLLATPLCTLLHLGIGKIFHLTWN